MSILSIGNAIDEINDWRDVQMSVTKDNDKKKKDNNARNQMKNQEREKAEQAGKHQYSKKTDHL